MPWSGHRHTGRLRLPEPASVRTTRVTVAVLSSWDRGQENPAVARCELPRQAYTSQPDFNRVGREQAERACPKMTSEGNAPFLNSGTDDAGEEGKEEPQAHIAVRAPTAR